MSVDAPLTVVARALAQVPATCGELLQGVDDDGPVLVSLPIALQGTVDVALVREPVVSVVPDLPRARAALRIALDVVGWQGGAVVRLGCEVPRGRGMGSSTVDVAGVIAGVAVAAGRSLPPHDLVALLTSVEPSDSSPLPGLWAIDHVRGGRASSLGPMPHSGRLVVVDSGEAADTLEVHRRYGAGPVLETGALQEIRRAVAAGSWTALGRVATRSAQRNQARLAHSAFATMSRLCASSSCAGIAVAHSGSLCALICEGDVTAQRAADALRAAGLACTTWIADAPGLHVELLAGQTRPSQQPQREVSYEMRGSAHV